MSAVCSAAVNVLKIEINNNNNSIIELHLNVKSKTLSLIFNVNTSGATSVR